MDGVLDYSDDVRRLAASAADPAALDETLHTALRALADAVPYDLAVLYELHDDVLVARAAEGVLVDERVRTHRLELSRFPTIRDALRRRRPTPLDEHDHAGDEGDPYDGVLDLPHGHSCMVVPLYADQRDIGIITLDRRVCEPYAEERVKLAGVYGDIVSLAIVHAEQAALLDRYRRQLAEENRLLRAQHTPAGGPGEQLLRARAPAMRELAQTAKQVAEANVPVLIEGETGVGKELLAAAVHEWSERRERPIVKINCAAIPEHLVESELFGHVRGAFSGATRDRDGRFVTANGGTLLLDEVGEMPLAVQAKLLRVLQESTFEPVGADRTIRVDVRVIAATNIDLRRAVEDGSFREDLYFRLAVFPLRVPPLRERLQDIEPIVDAHLRRLRNSTGRGPWVLAASATRALARHEWPGNIRELLNSVERAVIVRPQGELIAADFGLGPPRARASRPSSAAGDVPDPTGALPTFREQERAFLIRALQRTGGRVSGKAGAAELLDLKPTTLWSKIKKHGLDPKKIARQR